MGMVSARADSEGRSKVAETQAKVPVDDASADPPGEPVSWRQVWQVPAAVGSLGLVLLALVLLFQTRPTINFQAVCEEARQLAEAGKFDAAFERLVEAERHQAKMGEHDREAFLLTRADLFYERQMSQGGIADHNLGEAVKDYVQVEKSGVALSPQHLYQMGDALIRLEHADEVPAIIERIPPSSSSLRQRLIKSLVDRNLAMSNGKHSETADLLMKLMAEPDLKAEDRIWSVARLTELRLQQGFIDEAVDKLLVSMQQLRADGIREFPELYLLLGRGFFELGRYESSDEYLQTAVQGLPGSNPLRGEAILLQARLAQQRMQWDEAYQLLDTVVVTYAGTKSFLPALLARADVQAQLGNRMEAMDDYNSVVRALAERKKRIDPVPPLTDRQVCNSLLIWHDRQRDDGSLVEALQFARIAESLYPNSKDLPEDLVLRLAQTNWALGDSALTQAWKDAGIQLSEEGAPVEPDDAARIDTATRRQIQRYFLDAGEYYRRLAEIALQLEPDAAAEALRWASRCFDRGGEYLVAVQSLKEFVRLSAGQPRELWGIYMLGRSYQALGDYEGAIKQFKTLVVDHHNSIEAQRSYVPLAQCYLSLDRPNPAETERLLTHVVDGGAELNPGAREFGEALIELGLLYSHAADYPMPRPTAEYYPEAIRRLTEATERYPDDPRINDLQYQLAHAYRLSAKSIQDELTMERPEAERIRLNQTRMAHLDAARKNYDQAIVGDEAIPPHKRSSQVQQNLKFATFWRADCAFDQGAYQEAIRLYSGVADQYSEDATAIVALIQIVNAYAALNDIPAARTAQNRAWRLLRDLPNSAFDVGPLPLNRDAWERVLKSNELTASGELSAASDSSP